MVQLINLNRVMSKMAMIAIITMLFAGIVNAHTVQNTRQSEQAIEQSEPKIKLCRHCKEEKQVCKARKQENRIQRKANRQLCREICRENRRP
jgi:uncharacterized GH25 family protein